MVPRREPIEKPDEPEMQSAYRMMRQEFGQGADSGEGIESDGLRAIAQSETQMEHDE